MAVDKTESAPGGSPRQAAQPGARVSSWIGRGQYGGLATVLSLAGWLLLLLGQRVLATKETAALALTIAAVAGLVVGFALRIADQLRCSADRRSAARAFTALSAAGLLALAGLFASTDQGRELLGIDKPKLGEADAFGEVLTVAWIGLLAVSVLPTVLGELSRASMIRAQRFESRRVMAAVVAGIALALAAVYGSLFTFTAEKLELSVDYSYFRTAKPSESTRRMITTLSEPLKVLLFFPPMNEVGKKVEQYMQQLGKDNELFSYEVYDRLLHPELAEDNKVRKDGVIVLLRGETRENLEIGVELGRAAHKLKTLDGEFQKALLQAVRSKRTAYLTVGHGEMNETTDSREGRTTKMLQRHLESLNYRVKNLGLADGLAREVPDDATIVMVLGPSKPFLPEEIETLERYADGGGHLLLALDPDGNVDLDPLARVVGLKWRKGKVAHDQHFVPRRRNPSDKVNVIAKRFSSHAAVSTLSKLSARGAAVLLPGAAALEKRDDAPPKLAVDFAIKSRPQSYIDLDGSFGFDEGTEKRSVYNLVAAVSKPAEGPAAELELPADEEPDPKSPQQPKEADAGPAEMRAFVIGDVDAFSDAVLGYAQTNVLLVLEAVRWLGGEESFSGQIESEEDIRIVQTKTADQVWFYLAIIGVPSAVLAIGLLLTRRTKRRHAAARPSGPQKPPKPPSGQAPKKPRADFGADRIEDTTKAESPAAKKAEQDRSGASDRPEPTSRRKP